MNTLDAVHDQGGLCANFLDTGGKATSATVKTSFGIILNDPRVKVIFVNIFGGLTLCDMIAEGIILAYRDLQIRLPVVVRLRGTNEEIGQRMVCCFFVIAFSLVTSKTGTRLIRVCRSKIADYRYMRLMISKRQRRR